MKRRGLKIIPVMSVLCNVLVLATHHGNLSYWEGFIL